MARKRKEDLPICDEHDVFRIKASETASDVRKNVLGGAQAKKYLMGK